MSVVFDPDAGTAVAVLGRSSDGVDVNDASGNLGPHNDVEVDELVGRPRKGRHCGRDSAVLQRCGNLGSEHARHG